MSKKVFLVLLLVVISIIFFEGCYYDKADQQYPSTVCDTTVVTYTVEIMAILDANCKTCHGGSADLGGGIQLYDYNVISGLALDGKFTYGTLLSAVLHEGGAPPMPQGGNKLPECDINKFRAWVNRGAPN